ncbi:hypothetical protein VB776_06950 [Arcicella sp. DC2W]|uniref:Uncharacterized protein n=1 Tax=Arcicella gelida TaxID=2984195 RepID=A0ABU5S2I3_9BACT|nr:hypothetical protein [Arcicella sp. DC2W]MEA5402645.1 hypothetical protein [Arcicella sp. DC2W]
MEKVIWIKVTETITRKMGFLIDENQLETANELVEIGKTNTKLNPDSKEYFLLNGYLNNEITDTNGYDNIEVFIEEDEKGKYKFRVGDTFYSQYLTNDNEPYDSIPIKVISMDPERDIISVQMSNNSRIEKWILSCSISALINGDYSFQSFT